MTRAILLVGTAKGAFLVESDGEPTVVGHPGPLCEGWPIHDLIVEPGSGALLAGGGRRGSGRRCGGARTSARRGRTARTG